MAKTKLENLRLGIFVVFGTILLVLAAYLIGNRQNMFGGTFEISAIFNNASGLQNGNNVRFSGLNVGTVNKIEMINDTTIRVHMIIEDKMQNFIRKDAIATIGSDGLVGSMLINLLPGEGSASLIKPGDELESYSKIGTQDMLNTLNVTNENAAMLTSDLLKVTQSLIKGKGTLGKLLNDTVMASDLQQTISNLKHTSQRANTAIYELNKIVGGITHGKSAAGVLLTDSLTAQKMRNIFDHLENSSIDISKMASDLNTVVRKVKEGNGAVDYLTSDSLFVIRLDSSMKNIEEGTARFNENMEALKHNFLTRGYFRKLEKKEKKANAEKQ